MSSCEAQTLTLAPDSVITGPFRTARVNVAYNDIIPLSAYTLTVPSPPTGMGATVVKPGGFIEFTPNAAAIPANVSDTTRVLITYRIQCGATVQTSTFKVKVTKYNNPANIISADVDCFKYMGVNSSFDIEEKFHTAQGPDKNAAGITAGYGIDGFTSPLVGDLNGDGKPEIVIIGTNSVATGWQMPVRSINIYSGQTGDLKHMAVLTKAPAHLVGEPDKYTVLGLTDYDMGADFHRSPSILALADVDSDDTAEIIYCDVDKSHVYALKPKFVGENIVSVSTMWKSSHKYRAETGDTRKAGKFVYPHPYIADLNGDGIPEVIVYNKIYNAKTGVLLMEWGGGVDGSDGVFDSEPNNALKDERDALPASTQAIADKIRKVAMTGRRPHDGGYYDRDLAVPAIVDLDDDGLQEIVTGNRIHRFSLTNVNGTAGNKYIIENGPAMVTLPVSGIVSGSIGTKDYHLNDGFTRVADIDGDGRPDILAIAGVNTLDDHRTILIYVWDPVTKGIKAALTFYANTSNGSFSIPFVGDINGRIDGWDGTGWTRKLPEICVLTGGVYTTSAPSILYQGRCGLGFHPKSVDPDLNVGKFNKKPLGGEGHIVGLTYDGSAANIQERLKISWAMEHNDDSNNTGITLFDFDNNGAMDLCYRDMATLRIVSPAKSGKDYVKLAEKASDNLSVLVSKPVRSYTGYEYPVIADVNMDGSADIVVTGHPSGRYAVGVVYVFQYKGREFAPCPPVWNQSMYDPLQVREDLKINARPISMLTRFRDPVGNDYVQPYNGSWIQRPIIRAGDEYKPIVRLPEATITDMKVTVQATDTRKAEVELTIFNRGSASISSAAPISFFTGGAFIEKREVGVDVFPNEKVTRVYDITHSSSLSGKLVLARILADALIFPATGFDDCNEHNNEMEGSHCPGFKVSTTVYPSAAVCGTTGTVKLSAVGNYTPASTTFQWYKNDVDIPKATDSVLYVSEMGDYNCRVREGDCIARTNYIKVTVGSGALPALELTASPASGQLCASGGSVVISPKVVSGYANPRYEWYRDNVLLTTTTRDHTATVVGLYRLNIVDGACMVTDTFRVTQTLNTAPTVSDISAPAMACSGTRLTLTLPNVADGGGAVTAQGWEWSATLNGTYFAFDPVATAVTLSDHGKYLRYKAENYCGASYNTAVRVSVADKPSVARIGVVAPICWGSHLVATSPNVSENNATATGEWRLETNVGADSYVTVILPLSLSASDNGKRIHYRASNSCGEGYSDTAVVTVVASPTAGTLSYNGGGTICTAAGAVSPVWAGGVPTGGAGAYSSASGLSLDPTTGIITPLSSASGTYTVSYTVQSGVCPGLTRTAQVEIKVCTDLELTASAPAAICENATDTIRVKVRNRSTVSATGLKITEVFPSVNLTLLSWHPSAGTTFVGDEWNIGALASGASAELKLAVRGRVAVASVANRVYVSEANGVGYQDYVTATIKSEIGLEVKSTPVVSVRAGGNICLGDTVHLFKVVGGASPWTITYNDGIVDRNLQSSSPIHVYSPSVAGDSTFRSVRVTSSNGCDSSSTATATVISTGEAPTVSSFTIDEVCSGVPLTSGGIGFDVFVPSVAWNNSASASAGWRMEKTAGQGVYEDFNSPFTVTRADEGKGIYYTATNGCGVNNSAASFVRVYPEIIYPDIRIQLCPFPSRSIYLSGYLDTLNLVSLEWSEVSSGSPGFVAGTRVTTGELHTHNMAYGVHTYKYEIVNECGVGEAKAFVKNTRFPIIRNMSDTLVICRDMPLSSQIQLNQMLGLEVQGTWSYESDLDQFLSFAHAGSNFIGSLVLNAVAAWAALYTRQKFRFVYGSDNDAALFRFYYVTTNNSCLGSVQRELVVIVTSFFNF